MSSRLRMFRWLISGRWQPRDLSRKAPVMVEEEEGSNNIGYGCSATSWLQVVWSQQGCGCNRRKTGQWCARLLQRRTAAIRSERPLLVVITIRRQWRWQWRGDDSAASGCNRRLEGAGVVEQEKGKRQKCLRHRLRMMWVRPHRWKGGCVATVVEQGAKKEI
ncbi:hypothetical protein BHM03_00023310, partial [Ensete ventricosum]